MTSPLATIGNWTCGDSAPAFDGPALGAAAGRFREAAHVVQDAEGRVGVGFGGRTEAASAPAGYRLLGTLPPTYPEWLGDRAFTQAHRLRFPYVAGEMANGIATARIVVAMARAGMLGFYGAAGLMPPRVEAALHEIERELGAGEDAPSWGVNLIHSPAEPDVENAVAELLVRHDVRRICASAFMGMTPAVVLCAASGLRTDAQGRVVRRRHIFAKVSRPEVALPFMSPAPPPILDALLASGRLTRDEAALARAIPVAEDVTIEADSGGHTDNRPLGALFPVMRALRDEVCRRHDYARPIRLGAAGGLGTPAAVAAAFQLGASYVLTGSVNQAAVEAGLSDEGKRMLAEAGIADVIMAPAADMFELGVKVQVLRRGTMFGTRALRLYDLYTSYDGLDAMPPDVKRRLEEEVLGAPCDEVAAEVERFFRERDPRELDRAARDPKHHMALCFRWYLGMSSKWAIVGTPGRRLDYQIWCGPAMGSFNDWTRGSFLQEPKNRTVEQIAKNLLEGAATIARAQQLRAAGVALPPSAFHYTPRMLR